MNSVDYFPCVTEHSIMMCDPARPLAPEPISQAKFLYCINRLIQNGTIKQWTRAASDGMTSGFSLDRKESKNLLASLYQTCIKSESSETVPINPMYVKAANVLLERYFSKVGPYTFAYEDIPLYEANEAEELICHRIESIIRSHA
eukprot:TRINITY_DN1047_c0_g1_i1.p1 TRINITY_DN1047_c0_g1~~TRINITY_DN1047_c0_g1_i1.p1  ORF type:complete len:145 (+),score=18.25 TRINITY_DN1047_c0_g1_i1:56-490(+)